MLVVVGLAILVVLLWATKRSRGRGILNITQQRLSGMLALAIAVLLSARGDWGLGLGLGLFGFNSGLMGLALGKNEKAKKELADKGMAE